MILFPNAKINLGLNVVRRRPDGYHDIETLFYPVPWRDVLEIVPAKGETTTLTVTGREVDCPPEKNLVMKAYNALNALSPLPPVDIYLQKIIPDGAGLGGGSADASFTLRGLNRMFSLGYNDEELAAVATTIGADCPFFIYNIPMIATGIGNVFTPLDLNLSSMTVAIVKPPVSVSTKEAYSGITPAPPAIDLRSTLLDPVECWHDALKNDFEESIFPLHPQIAEVKDKLYRLGADYAAMSGSGASVFGLFTDGGDILADTIRKTFPGCDTLVSPLTL